MKFEEYVSYFEAILEDPSQFPIYTDEEYLNYTKLNWSRMNRWLKKFEVSEDIKHFISGIQEPQKWLLITEPWCGDAAHSVPQIYKVAACNPLIELDIHLRDTQPFLIDQYLTNGGKSIPKLIIRNENGEDLGVWGPRPDKLQELFLKLKDEGLEFVEIKEVVQKWYNEDKGVEIQVELKSLLS